MRSESLTYVENSQRVEKASPEGVGVMQPHYIHMYHVCLHVFAWLSLAQTGLH